MPKGHRSPGEGSAYREGDGWTGDLTVRGKRYRRRGFETKSEALRWIKQLLLDQQSGKRLPSGRQRLDPFLRRWLKSCVYPPMLETNTYRSYEKMVRIHILPSLGSLWLDEIMQEDVQALIAEKLSAGLKRSTVDRIVAVLRTALSQAVEWRLLSYNVAARPKLPPRDAPPVKALTVNESRKIVAALQGERLWPLHAFTLAVGCRQGESLGLLWRDVDLQTGEVKLYAQLQRTLAGKLERKLPKQRGVRIVRLSPGPLAVLRAWRARQAEERLRAGQEWQDTGLVFTTREGKPLSGRNIRRDFQRALAAASLPIMCYHDLRHVAASLMLARTGDLFAVSKFLGHRSVDTTARIYGHLLNEGRQRVSDAMEEVFDAERGDNMEDAKRGSPGSD